MYRWPSSRIEPMQAPFLYSNTAPTIIPIKRTDFILESLSDEITRPISDRTESTLHEIKSRAQVCRMSA
jgi:hypothetical protein